MRYYELYRLLEGYSNYLDDELLITNIFNQINNHFENKKNKNYLEIHWQVKYYSFYLEIREGANTENKYNLKEFKLNYEDILSRIDKEENSFIKTEK